MEGLSVVCAGLGVADEDEMGAVVGYAKGQYCLGRLCSCALWLLSSIGLVF